MVGLLTDWEQRVTDTEAQMSLVGGGQLDVQRDPLSAIVRLDRKVSQDELVHPTLAGPAVIFARWLGHEAFHAGAFVVDGVAWGVLGDKEAGKSTLLARLSLEGEGVVADDLLVLTRDGKALAGPRGVDLRPDSVPYLKEGSALRIVRDGTRQRALLNIIDPEIPFGGWITLSWGDRLQARKLDVREKLPIIFASRSLQGAETASPDVPLHLASLPAFALQRPRDWHSFASVTKLLREIARKTA